MSKTLAIVKFKVVDNDPTRRYSNKDRDKLVHKIQGVMFDAAVKWADSDERPDGIEIVWE